MATKPHRVRPSHRARLGETRERSGGVLEIMTVEQVAGYLQLNKLTVYKYVREGRIPAAKLGKAYRIRKSDLDWFLETQRLRPGRQPARRGKAEEPAQVAAELPAEQITPRPGRSEPLDLRERELILNPMEWVIRELH